MKKRASRKATKRGRVLVRASAANLLFLVALYGVLTFTGERNWLAASAVRVPQALALPLALLFVWSLVSRNWRAAGVSLLAAVFYTFTLLGLNVPLHRGQAQSGDRLRVVSFNVRQGAFGVRELAQVISDQDAQVLCLQEVNPLDKLGDPLPGLRESLPDRWHTARSGDVATLSRCPIISHKAHPLPADTAREVLETSIDVNGRVITVLNTHFNVASVPRLATRAKESLPELMGHTADVLSEQMRFLMDIAGSCKNPVIIAGDLNLTPLGPIYGRAASHYKDAFREAGWGFGYTSRPDRPLFRIDYIFVDKSISVNDCSSPRDIVSDHRLVAADIGLPE